jgi:hypothetical protein
MIRKLAISTLALAGVVALTAPSRADVFVRAPFVRVSTGDAGTYVRAPFVNIAIPKATFYPPPAFLVPQGPLPGAPLVNPFPADGPTQILPPPKPVPGGVEMIRPMTLSEFAKCFKGGCGKYEALLINPCTCQPCVVRFCLPDCPRRVTCGRDEVVFHYGLAKKVRIHFDCHGPTVVCRGP